MNIKNVTYKEVCEKIIKTKKYKEFEIYFKERVKNIDNPITNKKLGCICKLQDYEIKYFDSKLVENEILYKCGYYYMKYNVNDKSNHYEITREEYEKHITFEKALSDINCYLHSYVIRPQGTIEDYMEEIKCIFNKCKEDVNFKVYRLTKYKINYESEGYKVLCKLIDK